MARLAQQTDGHDLLIGIGGGRVLDTVKGVAYLLEIVSFLIPPLISNNPSHVRHFSFIFLKIFVP